MSKPAFPAGALRAEGTLIADPKKISGDNKQTTISLKTKLNYREREDDELDSFLIDVLVTGSTADNILKSGWKKYDRIFFEGDFKGHRWERKLDEGGVNEEQSISVFARHIGASPRFTSVEIEEQEYDGDAPSSRSRRNDDDDEPRRRRRGSDDDDGEERSSRRSSRRSDDDEDDAPRRSRRSRDDDDDDADDNSGPARRSSRRARSTSYSDDD